MVGGRTVDSLPSEDDRKQIAALSDAGRCHLLQRGTVKKLELFCCGSRTLLRELVLFDGHLPAGVVCLADSAGETRADLPTKTEICCMEVRQSNVLPDPNQKKKKGRNRTRKSKRWKKKGGGGGGKGQGLVRTAGHCHCCLHALYMILCTCMPETKSAWVLMLAEEAQHIAAVRDPLVVISAANRMARHGQPRAMAIVLLTGPQTSLLLEQAAKEDVRRLPPSLVARLSCLGPQTQ